MGPSPSLPAPGEHRPHGVERSGQVVVASHVTDLAAGFGEAAHVAGHVVLAGQAAQRGRGVVPLVEPDDGGVGDVAHRRAVEVGSGVDGGPGRPVDPQAADVHRGAPPRQGREVVDDGVGDRDGFPPEQRIAVVAVLGAGRHEQAGPGRAPADVGAGEGGEAHERVASPHRHDVDAARYLEVAVPREDVGGTGVRGGAGGGVQQGRPGLGQCHEVVEVGDDLDPEAVVADGRGPAGRVRGVGGRGCGSAAAGWSSCDHWRFSSDGRLAGSAPLLSSVGYETTDRGGGQATAAQCGIAPCGRDVTPAGRGAGGRGSGPAAISGPSGHRRRRCGWPPRGSRPPGPGRGRRPRRRPRPRPTPT